MPHPPHALRWRALVAAGAVVASLLTTTASPVHASTTDWVSDFEDGTTDAWQAVQRSSTGRLQVVGTPSLQGRNSARVLCGKQDQGVAGAGNAWRTELRASDAASAVKAGTTAWWSWKQRFGSDFAAPVSGGWAVVAQFHAGQGGTSPTLAFEITPANAMIVRTRGGELTAVRQQTATVIPKVERNRNYQLETFTRWSTSTDGLVQVHLDGTLVAELKGPNLYSGVTTGGYFKMGCYRSDSSIADGTIWLDDVRRTALRRATAAPATTTTTAAPATTTTTTAAPATTTTTTAAPATTTTTAAPATTTTTAKPATTTTTAPATTTTTAGPVAPVAQSPLPASAKVNFQPATVPVPVGHAVDSGQGFDVARGYGWVSQTSSAPKSMVGQAFDRNATSDQRLDTLIHVQTQWRQVGGRWTPTVDPARWEHAVANGTYDVTVTAGDSANSDGTHVITVEGTKAIDRFVPTTSVRHATRTVRVTVTDGRITLDGSAGDNTKLNSVSFTRVAVPTAAKVNFQPGDVAVPAGSTADSGKAFDAARGYGWIAATSSTPKSLEGRAFKRNINPDPRLDSLINVTERWTQVDGRWTSTADPARWEHAVTNGTYDVTLSVGDSANADGVHVVNVEGIRAGDAFAPTTTNRHATRTVRVTVTDGRLTLDATGGTNTKLNHVEIAPVTTASAESTTAAPSPTLTTAPPTTTTTTAPTTTTTTTAPTTTTTTTAPTTTTTPAPTITMKGDVATAEPGLVKDPNVLWTGTFETTPDWKKTFFIDAANNLANTSIVNAPGGRTGKSLQVTVPGSADQTQKRGMDFHSGFRSMGIGGQTEAHLRYYVWIPATHDFVDGGKMPGLAGTRPGTAPTAVGSGGNYSEDGWSGRLLFHGDAGLTTYLYVAGVGTKTIDENRNKTNGRIFGFTYRFHENGDTSKPFLKMKRGAWNQIELYYKMNTPGKSDGVFRGTLNGTVGRTLTNVQYRAAGKGDLDINQIFMSSFYGGALGPKTTQTYTFDDVVVSKAPIGPWRP